MQGRDGAIASHHRRVDAEAWANVYVVGDVHGCRTELDTLLDRLDPSNDELVVFVGDLVRKGPDSRGVLDAVLERPNFLTVRGNNEQKLLDGEDAIGLAERQRTAIADLPVALSWDGGLVVHGGLDPRRALAEHTARDVLTMRAPRGDGYDGPFWYEGYDGPRRVFFGHTVHEAPVDRPWAVGLDTGCVYGGALTAYDTGRDRFVSVSAERTYQERDQWVSPSPTDRPVFPVPAAAER
jgi:serine/threonine protein phosphatase 1